MDRGTIIEGLKERSDVEVLVVGAGINGIGVFRDLARQGVAVLLVDRGDFCSGASATSSHMAHGGIRYLENGEFRLVREAVNERNRLLVNAPHLVKPLPTVVPMFRLFSGLLNAPFKFLGWLDKPSERGAVVIKVGLMLYDALTQGRRVVPKHRFEGRKKTRERYPELNPEVKYAAMYYDGQLLSPERLAVELVLDAEAEGPHARALSYAPLIGAEAADGSLRIRDELGGQEIRVKPRVIVNAAGPWIDPVNAAFGLSTRYIEGTKGSHIVVDNPALRAAMGDHEFFFENSDGRIVLMLAWYDRVLIGTSDLPIDDADKAVCTEEEIEYFIGLVSRIFPGIPVTKDQIVFTFSGVRPLPPSTAKNVSQISRDHSIGEDRLGAIPVLSLVGGKWTAFRAFGEQVTDRVLGILGKRRKESTQNLAIGGGAAWPSTPAGQEELALKLVRERGLPFERATQLFDRYGTRAGLFAERLGPGGKERMLENLPGYSREEIASLIALEKVERLDDLVLRRSTIAWLGRARRPLLEELAAVMGESLGWSPAKREAEVERVATLLRERHRVEPSR
ncbi:MAG TPA: glycerol-3-phosphate dehydrogenase/oxidase [Rectinemataceae bacterium]|nr:glycerol-3-phosphate dehydrogenase/oxidase [Rectinemataceae bacterium]